VSDHPYGALAPWYDEVMAHVDYPQWAAHVALLWQFNELSPRKVLETAAGTLAMAPFLKRKGRTWVHSDLSWEMLNAASLNPLQRKPLPPRVAADYGRLPFRSASFDALVCLYDAINYCLDRESLERYFQEAARVLKPGGTLLFDFVTTLNSARYFREFTTHELHQGAHIIRESSWDPSLRIQHNSFTFFLPDLDGRFQREQEHHMQRMWPMSLFKSMAKKAGLEWLGNWDGFTLDPSRRDSERVHVLCRKL
jgi:SAM-dependent methyltransferase